MNIFDFFLLILLSVCVVIVIFDFSSLVFVLRVIDESLLVLFLWTFLFVLCVPQRVSVFSCCSLMHNTVYQRSWPDMLKTKTIDTKLCAILGSVCLCPSKLFQYVVLLFVTFVYEMWQGEPNVDVRLVEHTHTHTCTNTHMQAHAYMHKHTHTQTHTHIYIHTLPLSCLNQNRKCWCQAGWTHTHKHTHAHTHMQAHAYMHTHTHAHTYTHCLCLAWIKIGNVYIQLYYSHYDHCDDWKGKKPAKIVLEILHHFYCQLPVEVGLMSKNCKPGKWIYTWRTHIGNRESELIYTGSVTERTLVGNRESELIVH